MAAFVTPAISLQLASTALRIAGQTTSLGLGAYSLKKRLRSESSNMPLFGMNKKAKASYSAMMRKRATSVRMSRQLQFKGVHTFRRMVGIPFTYSSLSGMQTGSNTLQKGMAVGISLQQVAIYGSGSVGVAIPGATDLTGLFDAWRVKNVKIELVLTNNSSSQGSLLNGLPVLVSCIDSNDLTAPTTRDEIAQDSTARVDRMDDTHKWVRYFKPTTTTTLAENTGFATQLSGNTWIPTANPGAYYPGLKVWSEVTGTTATATANMFMYVSIVYECKDYN